MVEIHTSIEIFPASAEVWMFRMQCKPKRTDGKAQLYVARDFCRMLPRGGVERTPCQVENVLIRAWLHMVDVEDEAGANIVLEGFVCQSVTKLMMRNGVRPKY